VHDTGIAFEGPTGKFSGLESVLITGGSDACAGRDADSYVGLAVVADGAEAAPVAASVGSAVLALALGYTVDALSHFRTHHAVRAQSTERSASVGAALLALAVREAFCFAGESLFVAKALFTLPAETAASVGPALLAQATGCTALRRGLEFVLALVGFTRIDGTRIAIVAFNRAVAALGVACRNEHTADERFTHIGGARVAIAANDHFVLALVVASAPRILARIPILAIRVTVAAAQNRFEHASGVGMAAVRRADVPVYADYLLVLAFLVGAPIVGAGIAVVTGIAVQTAVRYLREEAPLLRVAQVLSADVPVGTGSHRLVMTFVAGTPILGAQIAVVAVSIGEAALFNGKEDAADGRVASVERARVAVLASGYRVEVAFLVDA